MVKFTELCPRLPSFFTVYSLSGVLFTIIAVCRWFTHLYLQIKYLLWIPGLLTQLSNIPTWMSYRHFKSNMSNNELVNFLQLSSVLQLGKAEFCNTSCSPSSTRFLYRLSFIKSPNLDFLLIKYFSFLRHYQVINKLYQQFFSPFTFSLWLQSFLHVEELSIENANINLSFPCLTPSMIFHAFSVTKIP